MNLVHSRNRKPAKPEAAVAKILAEVSSDNLRSFVEALAFPRHYFAENRANRRARDLLLEFGKGFGYQPTLQGEFDNVVMSSAGLVDNPQLLLGAHYHSVPGTPGTDDPTEIATRSPRMRSVDQTPWYRFGHDRFLQPRRRTVAWAAAIIRGGGTGSERRRSAYLSRSVRLPEPSCELTGVAVPDCRCSRHRALATFSALLGEQRVQCDCRRARRA